MIARKQKAKMRIITLKRTVITKSTIIGKIALILLMLSGCATQERCAERFPPKEKFSISTQINDSIVYVHDTVLVPYQELTFVDDIPCPEVNYTKSVKSNGLKSTVTIKDGKLTSKCEADSLRLVIENKEHFITTLKKELSVKATEVVKYVDRWYNPYSLYISIAAIVALAVWLYLKLGKLS